MCAVTPVRSQLKHLLISYLTSPTAAYYSEINAAVNKHLSQVLADRPSDTNSSACYVTGLLPSGHQRPGTFRI